MTADRQHATDHDRIGRNLTLKAPRKTHLLKSSAELNSLTLLTNLSMEANRVDRVGPDRTAPIGAVRSGSTQFVIEAS